MAETKKIWTEAEERAWARDLIALAHKQDVDVTIFKPVPAEEEDPDETARVRRLQRILNNEKDIVEGENQLAKLALYYMDHGWIKELKELLGDKIKTYRAFLKIAQYELYKKLGHKQDYATLNEVLDDREKELEMIKADPDLAAWVPDWILAEIEKWDEIEGAEDADKEDDAEGDESDEEDTENTKDTEDMEEQADPDADALYRWAEAVNDGAQRATLQINALTQILLKNDQIEELKKAAEDRKYQASLLEKYRAEIADLTAPEWQEISEIRHGKDAFRIYKNKKED